jgi:Chaperone of endosialidase
MTTATHNYGWLMPDPGGSANTWGNVLNGTTQAIDAKLWSLNAQLTVNRMIISRGPDSGPYGDILFQNYGSTQVRWQLAESSEAEGAGNTGTNFFLTAYDNSGSFLGNVFEVIRATQTVNFSQAVTVGTTLSVGGGATVGTLSVAGNVLCGTALYPCYGPAPDWYFFQSGGYHIQNLATSWSQRWNTANGVWDWVGPSGDLMVLDGGGALTVTSDFTTLSGNLHVRAASSGNSNIWFTRNDSAQMGVVYYDIGAGNIIVQNQVGGGWAQINGSANFIVNGTALKPGGGAWLDSSDARIKTITGSYSSGLDQISKLNPVRFRYKGNDGDAHALVKGKEFIGLVADEAMRAMPELVSLGEGEVDGRRVNDLKMLDPSAIIYALINAVKELKAEIEELKGAR